MTRSGEPTTRKSLVGRLWNAVIAAWGAVTGILPHVLHHVGTLAGTALVAGTGGTILFAVLGLAASIPFLLRLRRRFDSWLAPAIGLAAFVAAFTFSTLVIGPLISGERNVQLGDPAKPSPAATDQHGHSVED